MPEWISITILNKKTKQQRGFLCYCVDIEHRHCIFPCELVSTIRYVSPYMFCRKTKIQSKRCKVNEMTRKNPESRSTFPVDIDS